MNEELPEKIEIDLDLWQKVGHVVLASEKLLWAIETSTSAGAVFFAAYPEENLNLDLALKALGRDGFCYL